MLFKRARQHISFKRIACTLDTDVKTYDLWVEGDFIPNAKQIKLIRLWILDQLEVPKEIKKEEDSI